MPPLATPTIPTLNPTGDSKVEGLNYMVASVTESATNLTRETLFNRVTMSKSITPIGYFKWFSDANRVAELLAKDFVPPSLKLRTSIQVIELCNSKSHATHPVESEELNDEPYDGVPEDTGSV
jgi:hypothetical protein